MPLLDRLALGLIVALAAIFPLVAADTPKTVTTAIFERKNLVAWCIVPFDARNRTPEDRAAMLEKLGFKVTLEPSGEQANKLPTELAEAA